MKKTPAIGMGNVAQPIKKVAIYPSHSSTNAYIAQVCKSLATQGYEVCSLEECLSSKEMHAIPVILNWFDEVAGGWKAPLRFIKKVMTVNKLTNKGCLIICVVHNRMPHEAASSLARCLSLRTRRILCHAADAIVVLCDETRSVLEDQLGTDLYRQIESRVVKIPHPNYGGAYPETPHDFRVELGIGEDEFVFLFTGLIRKYKNIEVMLDVARRFASKHFDARFVIAGKCNDSDYLSELSKLSSDLDNVLFLPKYIPDDEILALVDSCDALMLPYNTASSLNSGTCMLSFSRGRTVVCPNIGTLLEFPPDLTFGYTYDVAANEHASMLYDAAEQAYMTWLEDRDSFRAKGARLQEIVSVENSLEAVGSAYASVFESIALDGA